MMRRALFEVVSVALLLCGLALPAAAVEGLAPAPPPPIVGPPAPAIEPVPSCLPAIAREERAHGIPSGLLRAVAMVESGRRFPDSNQREPWPWTINVLGAGRFLGNRADAVAQATQILSTDQGLMDVGCMQVNLYHHPHAFPSLTAAFEPDTNVRYAAGFLAQLNQTHHSWLQAVAAYHAGTPTGTGAAEYLAKVVYLWKGGQPATVLSSSRATTRGDDDEPDDAVTAELPPAMDIAVTFFENADFATAQAIYRAMLQDHPDQREALLGLATVFERQNKVEDARFYYERTLIADPTNRFAIDGLLRLIDGVTDQRRMIWLTSARQVAPSAAEFPARLAHAYAEQGDVGQAISQMGLAVQLAPDDNRYLLNYALLLDRGGYMAPAIRSYQRFLDSYRSSDGALTVSIEQVRQRLRFLLNTPGR
jgi:tetratricopeptide (TPR) repeat protein